MNSLRHTKNIASVFTPSITIYAIVYNIALIVGGAMLLALSSYISIPLWPVPITMQTYVVMVIGMTYGWKRAGATIITFMSAGAVGLPVFAGGVSGLFFHLASGGYIFGFLVSAMVLGYLSDIRHWDRNIKTAIVSMFIGTILIYLFGLSWLAVAVPSLDSLNKVLLAGLYPFIIGGIIKSGLAGLTIPFVWKMIQSSNERK